MDCRVGGNPMVTGRYDVTISRLMPIYNGNRARQGAHQGLFVRQVEERRKHTTFNQEFLQQEHPCMKILHCPIPITKFRWWCGGGGIVITEANSYATLLFRG